MTEKFAVIGLGIFGMSIARTLAEKGAEVLAVDIDPAPVDLIADDVAYAVAMDSTDKRALQSQNIHKMDAVVVSIGENFEAILLTCVMLKELGVKRLISRASNPMQENILIKLGITEILSPENEVGAAVATRLINPDIRTFMELPDEYEIAEVKIPRALRNKSVKDIQLREKYEINLITIKRQYEEVEDNELRNESHLIGVPKAETVLFEGDTLIIMGRKKDISRFLEINN